MLVDSHCHLDHDDFDADRAAVISRAHAAGVRRIVVPATHAANWTRLQRLCTARENIFAAYGLHPCFMQHHSDADLELLERVLTRPDTAVAVGEIGLDRVLPNPDESSQIAQLKLFDAQLHLARAHALPVIVHARGAVEAVIHAIRRVGNLNGVVHCYSGSLEQARQLIDLGFMLSFGGAITYSRAHRIRKLVRQLPLDAILLETDSPDQPDSEHKGQRNEPAHLLSVFNVLCELRTESSDTIAQRCYANTTRLFNLPQ